uniref:Uncharacterized protein n=1 Tax=Romanomermis culicivorax TaxID=13658 RepID=A0A915KKA8_ROMCU
MCAAVQHAVFKHVARKLIRAFEYVKLRGRMALQPDLEFDQKEIGKKDHDTSLYPRTLIFEPNLENFRNGLEKWNAGIDIMYNAPMTYYVEPRCPIGEDISQQISRYGLSRYVLNHTHSSLKINYDFNKPVPDRRTKKNNNNNNVEISSTEEEKVAEMQ